MNFGSDKVFVDREFFRQNESALQLFHIRIGPESERIFELCGLSDDRPPESSILIFRTDNAEEAEQVIKKSGLKSISEENLAAIA